MRSSSPDLTQQVSDARPQPKPHGRLACTIETLANLSNQLHQRLKGEVILVGDLLEMDTPLDYFLVETLYKVQVRN
jgi:hypothetical protein